MHLLELNDNFLAKVERGEKTSTLRQHRPERKIPDEGETFRLMDTYSGRSVLACVKQTQMIAPSQLNDAQVKAEGVETKEELYKILKGFYPDSEPDQPMHLIEFELIRVTGNIVVTYTNVGLDSAGHFSGASFQNAIRELEQDIGWGSWSDELTAVWHLLNIGAKTFAPFAANVSHSDIERHEIEVTVPASNIDWHENGITGLLGLVAGSVLGSSGMGERAQVKSLQLPPAVRRHFPGPNLGIEGIRTLCKVKNRPIVAFSVKPRLGLTAQQFAKVAAEAAAGGVDIVEDDERLSNQPFCSLLDRARAVQALLKGSHTLYSANVTVRPDRILETIKKLLDIDVRLFKIDVLPADFWALQAVAEYFKDNKIQAGITTFPGMNRLFRRGMSREIILDLCRLCGTDILYAGGFSLPQTAQQGTEELRTQDKIALQNAAESHRRLKTLGDCKSVLPTVGTAVSPLNINAYRQLLGNNVGFFVGAGIAAYSGGIKSGASLLMNALDGISIDDHLEEYQKLGFGQLIEYGKLSKSVPQIFNSVRLL